MAIDHDSAGRWSSREEQTPDCRRMLELARSGQGEEAMHGLKCDLLMGAKMDISAIAPNYPLPKPQDNGGAKPTTRRRAPRTAADPATPRSHSSESNDAATGSEDVTQMSVDELQRYLDRSKP